MLIILPFFVIVNKVQKYCNATAIHFNYIHVSSGFGGLQVAYCPLVPKFAFSNTAEAVGFFRAKKNPQHAFLRKGSKAVCPMSYIYGL